MKTCREIQRQASDLLEGDLTLTDRIGITMHLLICGDCRRSLRHLRLLIGSLALYPRQEYRVPAGFTDRILADMREKRPRSVGARNHDDDAPGDSVIYKN